MPQEDLVELKFRLYDGSDVGPFQYSPTATVSMLKERIVSEWPKGEHRAQSFGLLFRLIREERSQNAIEVLLNALDLALECLLQPFFFFTCGLIDKVQT